MSCLSVCFFFSFGAVRLVWPLSHAPAKEQFSLSVRFFFLSFLLRVKVLYAYKPVGLEIITCGSYWRGKCYLFENLPSAKTKPKGTPLPH